jgi:hypothetical protein
VVWDSEGSAGTDSSHSSIQGQRYDSSGSAVGGEFQVNTYTANFQFTPSVAVQTNGDFVVVWHSEGSAGTDSGSSSVQGQRFISPTTTTSTTTTTTSTTTTSTTSSTTTTLQVVLTPPPAGWSCGLGPELALVLPSLWWLRRRRSPAA